MELQLSWAVLLIGPQLAAFCWNPSFVCGQLAGGLGSGRFRLASAWLIWLGCTWLSPSSKLAWGSYHRKWRSEPKNVRSLEAQTLPWHSITSATFCWPKQATCPNPDLRSEERHSTLYGSIWKITLQRSRIQRAVKIVGPFSQSVKERLFPIVEAQP